MDCGIFDLGQCLSGFSRLLLSSPCTFWIIVVIAAVEAGVSLHRKRFEPGARFSFLPLAFLCMHRRGTMSVVDALTPLAYAVCGAVVVYAGLWIRNQYRPVERRWEGAK